MTVFHLLNTKYSAAAYGLVLTAVHPAISHSVMPDWNGP